MLSLNFSPFPVLETERLLLRCITANDTEALFILRSNERTNQYLNRPPDRSREETKAKIEELLQMLDSKQGILWVITFKEKTANLIGTIGYWRMQPEHYRAEIGYMLHPAHWQRGIMKEALHAVIKYGFEKMNIHSIEANINPDNLPSGALLESCGFMQEAYHKENYYFDGMFYDSIIYSKLNK